jgi:hypothetical protein
MKDESERAEAEGLATWRISLTMPRIEAIAPDITAMRQMSAISSKRFPVKMRYRSDFIRSATSQTLPDLNGGRAGTRTPDLLRVKQAL